MKFRQFLDELLFMTKAQRNASFVLVVLLIILLVIRVSLPHFIGSDDYSEEILLKIQQQNEGAIESDSVVKYQDDIEPFYFDPNTIGYSDLLKLGFKSKTASTLINFRKSGAVFHKAKDLKRVYGVDSVLFSNLKEYILIGSKNDEKDTGNVKRVDTTKIKTNKKTNPDPEEFADPDMIELNTADTSLLKQLSGIGSVFAARICKFRDYLGGFYSVEQLREVYNFPEETYQSILPFIKADTAYLITININFCSIDELKKHPYCKYDQSREIINNRSRRGQYKSVYDLLEDSVLSEPDFNKLVPYLTVKVDHPKTIK